MQRFPENTLIAVHIVATLVICWLGMMAIHEAGHVLAGWSTGGSVSKVVLHPLAISRTDLSHNPRPWIVVWGGPLFGTALPAVLWLIARGLKLPAEPWFRFFAGFCWIANGAYIGFGSLDRIGDAGDMLRHGSEIWDLWLFGAITIPAGLWLWHGTGRYFGLGREGKTPSRQLVLITATLAVMAVVAAAFFGGE